MIELLVPIRARRMSEVVFGSGSELCGSPDFVSTRLQERFIGVERGIPFREIQDRNVVRTVGGGVCRWRNLFLVL